MDNELKERVELALEGSMDPSNVSAAYDVLRYAKLGMYVTREELKAAVEAEREACGRLVKNLAISPTEGAALQIAISTRGETNDQ